MRNLRQILLISLFSTALFAATEESFLSRWELVPQVSVLTPTQIELVETKYDIPYKDILAGFPVMHLGVATPFKRFGDFHLYATAKAGFSYKRGYFFNSEMSLLMVPLAVGTKVQYISPDFPFVRPSLSFQMGTEFIRQNSSIASLNTSAWLPFYSITPMIGFFEGGSDWFNGFTFGVSYTDSFAVVQKVRSWSFDLSFSFLL